MNKDSFFLRLSRSIRAFVIICIIFISSIFVNYYVNNHVISEFLSDFLVSADQLDYIPSEYIPFSVLDSFDIETIFNLDAEVLIGFNVFSEIGEITASYGTLVVEYCGDYYMLGFDVPREGVSYAIPIQYVILSHGLSLISSIMVLFIALILLIKVLNILDRAFPFGMYTSLKVQQKLNFNPKLNGSNDCK